MTVCEMFEQYRINVAVCDGLLIELKHYGREAIEALQLSAYCMTDIPKSETNRIHQPTESLAISIDSINRNAIKVFKELTRDIEKVNKLVATLNERERFMIEHRYIFKTSRSKILQIAESKYSDGVPISWSTLKKDKRNAEEFLQRAIDEQLKIGKFIMEVAI